MPEDILTANFAVKKTNLVRYSTYVRICKLAYPESHAHNLFIYPSCVHACILRLVPQYCLVNIKTSYKEMSFKVGCFFGFFHPPENLANRKSYIDE